VSSSFLLGQIKLKPIKSFTNHEDTCALRGKLEVADKQTMMVHALGVPVAKTVYAPGLPVCQNRLSKSKQSIVSVADLSHTSSLHSPSPPSADLLYLANIHLLFLPIIVLLSALKGRSIVL